MDPNLLKAVICVLVSRGLRYVDIPDTVIIDRSWTDLVITTSRDFNTKSIRVQFRHPWPIPVPDDAVDYEIIEEPNKVFEGPSIKALLANVNPD